MSVGKTGADSEFFIQGADLIKTSNTNLINVRYVMGTLSKNLYTVKTRKKHNAE